jgi:cytochrome c oxidase assembly protein subunit 15
MVHNATIGTAPYLSAQNNASTSEIRNRTAVRLWLWIVAALVFAMVVVGGATRLTGSGLSITEWQPIMGALPPLSHADWEAAFAKYRAIPQFAIANSDMSLAGFQVIFWWEWSHRFLGRLIGVVFFVPFVAFIVTRQIGRAEIPKFVGLFVLGGLQGLVGWWMVASGLSERIDVAPYRLATHLTLACFIFVALVWTALTLDRPRGRREAAGGKTSATILLIAVLIQIFLGALVAGNDAGLVYNTWPSMNGTFVPPDIFALEPLWRNFFENHATVQFVHRLGAYTLFGLAMIESVGAIARARAGRREGKWIATALLLAISGQAGIGIATLLWAAPLSLALLHQAGAIVVLLVAVVNRVGFSGRRSDVLGVRH